MSKDKYAGHPHLWNKELQCILCHTTTLKAMKEQPETKGVGPCPEFTTELGRQRFEKFLEEKKKQRSG